jgi:hypothetical protein
MCVKDCGGHKPGHVCEGKKKPKSHVCDGTGKHKKDPGHVCEGGCGDHKDKVDVGCSGDCKKPGGVLSPGEVAALKAK